MKIREATFNDVQIICYLLKQMSFDLTETLIESKLKQLIGNPVYNTLIAEIDGKAVGLMTLHFWTQIGLEGDTCTISFFVVDENHRSQNIGKRMEEYACQIAKEKGCSEVELFSQEWRKDAHRFYIRQGYKAIEKFFLKELK